MKTTIRISIVIVTCFVFACTTELENIELGTPVTFENLRIYPVSANRPFLENRKNLGPYVTLRDAVESGRVVIEEKNEEPSTTGHESDVIEVDATVNTLLAENLSGDTVIILQGEMVNGGYQDRMIAQDVVLLPHSGKVDLSVFCVEHGRWSGEDEVFQVAEMSLPPNSVRGAASTSKDQEKVWEEVKASLETNEISSSSEAMMDLKIDERHVRELEKFRKLKSSFDDRYNVIGIVVVSGDKVIGCDLFATPAMFNTYFPNLLQSYASQALEMGVLKISDGDVKKYWNNILLDTKKEQFLARGDTRQEVVHFGRSY